MFSGTFRSIVWCLRGVSLPVHFFPPVKIFPGRLVGGGMPKLSLSWLLHSLQSIPFSSSFRQVHCFNAFRGKPYQFGYPRLIPSSCTARSPRNCKGNLRSVRIRRWRRVLSRRMMPKRQCVPGRPIVASLFFRSSSPDDPQTYDDSCAGYITDASVSPTR